MSEYTVRPILSMAQTILHELNPKLSWAMLHPAEMKSLEAVARWTLNRIDQLDRENTVLRAMVAAKGCAYNHFKNGMCEMGFPGCACMDDIFIAEELLLNSYREEIARLKAQLAAT